MTMNDEILDEIRRFRDAHAARFGYDLKKIVRDLQEQQRRSGVKVVSRPPRKPTIHGRASKV